VRTRTIIERRYYAYKQKANRSADHNVPVLNRMLSALAISILERRASKHGRFYERLLATLDIRVQEYIA
jgi:hypothetical protein